MKKSAVTKAASVAIAFCAFWALIISFCLPIWTKELQRIRTGDDVEFQILAEPGTEVADYGIYCNCRFQNREVGGEIMGVAHEGDLAKFKCSGFACQNTIHCIVRNDDPFTIFAFYDGSTDFFWPAHGAYDWDREKQLLKSYLKTIRSERHDERLGFGLLGVDRE